MPSKPESNPTQIDEDDDTVGVRAPDLSEQPETGVNSDNPPDADSDEDDLEDAVLDDDAGVDA